LDDALPVGSSEEKKICEEPKGGREKEGKKGKGWKLSVCGTKSKPQGEREARPKRRGNDITQYTGGKKKREKEKETWGRKEPRMDKKKVKKKLYS